MFFGSLLATLEAIYKKVVTLKPDLSSMTVGLAGCIEDAIRTRLQKVFNDDDAIIAAITVPKFKLKWVETQSKKRSVQANADPRNEITCCRQ